MVEAGKLREFLKISLFSLVVIQGYLLVQIEARCIPLGIRNSPFIYYDYQRDRIIQYGGADHQIHSLNYHTNISTPIVGIAGISGFNDGNGAIAKIGILGGLTGFYGNNDRIVGYLASDSTYSCVRYISADPPYNTRTVLGNCSHSGSVRGSGLFARLVEPFAISAGKEGKNWIYALVDQADSKVIGLRGNNTIMTSFCIVCNPVGLIFPRSLVYVENLLFNNTYLKVVDNGVKDILLTTWGYSELAYYYNGSFIIIGRVHEGPIGKSITSIKSYGSIIYAAKYQENDTSIYYGKNTSNLDKTTCPGYSNTMYDIIVLPNGTLIQSYITGYPLCLLNCTFPPYNRTIPSFTKSLRHTLSTSITNSNYISESSTETQKNRSASLSKTLSHSSKNNSYTSKKFLSNSLISETRKNTKIDKTSTESQSLKSGEKPSSLTISNTIMVFSRSKTINNWKRGNKIRSETQTFSDTKSFHMSESSHRFVDTTSKTIRSLSFSKVFGQKIFIQSSVKTQTVAVGVIVAITASAGSGRTVAFLAISSGECGSIRDLEWYENPFRGRLVFLGNIAFMLLIVLIILGLASLWEKYFLLEDKKSSTIREMLVKYSIVELLFMMWCFFLSPIFVSFVKYHTEVYDILSIILGGVYLICSVVILLVGMTDVFEGARRDNPSWIENTVLWFGNDLLVPIFDGYSSKKALAADVFITIVLAVFSTIEDCMYLASITLILNIGYCACLIKWKIIQPKCIAYSNISFVVGQSIGIILVIFNSYGTIGLIVVYLSSIIGLSLMFIPTMPTMYENLRNIVFNAFSNLHKARTIFKEKESETPILDIIWDDQDRRPDSLQINHRCISNSMKHSLSSISGTSQSESLQPDNTFIIPLESDIL